MEDYIPEIIDGESRVERYPTGTVVITGYDGGSEIVFTEHGAGGLLQNIIENKLTYCAGANKLDIIAWSVKRIKQKGVAGIFVEAGVAMGGSAIVSAKLKPPAAKLKLYDVFDLLPPPGEEDEVRAHDVYEKFASGVGTGQETDSKYLSSVNDGLLPTVIRNLNLFDAVPERDNIELIKGDFADTLFLDEGVAFAHVDCDWYRSVRCCIERIADHVVPGGIIVFDDYNSFSGARRAIDEWLHGERRFKVIDSRWSLVLVRKEDENESAERVLETRTATVPKPRILLLADRPGWAYDAAAKAVASRLGGEFDFTIRYVVDMPVLADAACDLVYVFFWGESYHCAFVPDPRKVVKEISSHRWENEPQYGLLSPRDMAQRFLADAGTLTCTSLRLQKLFSPFREIFLTPNGVDTQTFFDKGSRRGPLKIGWAGNIDDPCKGVHDILIPAAGIDFTLTTAKGDLSHREMCDFYNSIDVLCVASTAEGEPLTLLEGMACGCFPVCVDVGIVPELLQHRKNGLVIERTVASFRAAFQWCMANVDQVRLAGRSNAMLIRYTRSWEMTLPLWRKAFLSALDRTSSMSSQDPSAQHDPAAGDAVWHNNLGATLLEWPERARVAAKLVQALPLGELRNLVDLGCGRQTLRQFLPSSLAYHPVDRVARTPDTRVMDLDQELPEGTYGIAALLGVFEYLDGLERVLEWLAGHVRYCVFSINDCSDEEKRRRQHWRCTLDFGEVESKVIGAGGNIVEVVNLGEKERVYLVTFRPAFESRHKRLALFSAAVHGDNCGDALIEDAIRRILAGYEMVRFPLLSPLSPQQLDEVNACDVAIICGTNLYQDTFACALSPEVIERIKIPVLPLGVGASSPIGTLPRMDAAGIKAVRMLHERCALSSVRDPASLDFVRSLGIGNVELTGCPVLFHAGKEPDFSQTRGEGLYLAVRARLLHVDAGLQAKEKATLEHLVREFRPVLVLQSPYDIPLCKDLIEKYELNFLLDDSYSERPLVVGVENASRTAGFRLHFGMLSLSYGKHTTLIGTDTRVSEFCNMMGLSYHDVHSYTDQALVKDITSPPPSMTSFINSYRDLRRSMAAVLTANGLSSTLAGR